MFNRKRVHQTAKETGGSRWRKKLLGKTSWYKSKRKDEEEDDTISKGPGKTGNKKDSIRKSDLRTRAVLFVP